VVQEEQTTTTYLEGKRNPVQESVNHGAVGACPDIYLDANVLMLEGLYCSDLSETSMLDNFEKIKIRVLNDKTAETG
jgi:hypothetical protein